MNICDDDHILLIQIQKANYLFRDGRVFRSWLFRKKPRGKY